MFDLTRIGEGIVGMFGASGALGAGSVADLLTNAGIEPGMLQGLSPDAVMQLLSEHGVDLASFAPEQLQELSGLLEMAGQPGEALLDLASRFDPR